MAEAIKLAELNRLTRTAVKLIKGVQILQTNEDFEFAVFSVIGWFKVSSLFSIVCVVGRHSILVSGDTAYATKK